MREWVLVAALVAGSAFAQPPVELPPKDRGVLVWHEGRGEWVPVSQAPKAGREFSDVPVRSVPLFEGAAVARRLVDERARPSAPCYFAPWHAVYGIGSVSRILCMGVE